MPSRQREAQQPEGTRGPLGALELPAVGHPIAGWEDHRRVDGSLDVAHHAPHVAARYVAAHDQPALDVLAADLVGPAVTLHARRGTQRNARAPGSDHQQLAQVLERPDARRVRPHHQVEDRLALHDLRHHVDAGADLERARHVCDAHAVPSDGRAVEAHPREGDVRLLLAREVDHARDAAHGGLHLGPEATQLARGRPRTP
jgi:hypothetical protein